MNARAVILAGSLLTLACDARTTEPDANSASREAEAAPSAAAERANASAPVRDFAQLQRELASNEAELRQLGVLVATVADSEPKPEPTEESGMGGRSETKKAKTSTTAKKAHPSKDARDAKQAEGGVPGSSPARPSAEPGMAGGDAILEPAKSVQGRPTDQLAKQVQEDRCPRICSLSGSTCELTEEICELADRHTDDDTYSMACERANNDCKQAQEACLECLG